MQPPHSPPAHTRSIGSPSLGVGAIGVGAFDSSEERAFREEARVWLEANASRPLRPQIAPSALVSEWPPALEQVRLAEAQAWQRRKFEAGWAGIAWPTTLGGRGGSVVEQFIFAQEEGGFDVPHDVLAVGLGWVGPALLLLGSEVLKSRLVPPLLAGDEVWCQLFSEPGAGSDLARLETKAMRDGDEWVISGQKVWTTFAHQSDWGLCIARTDPEAPKHKGLTAFVVDMKAPGVTARPIRQMTGAASFNEVFLDDVRLPDTNRVGEVGDGWRVVVTTFMFERTSLLSISVPIEAALHGLWEERGNGDPVMRDRWIKSWIVSQVIAFTNLRLLTSIARGRIPGPEGSMVKLVGTLLLADLYNQAIDLLGADGMLSGNDAPDHGDWQSAFLGIPGLRIGGGTDQIQRNIIAERILGLPKDHVEV